MFYLYGYRGAQEFFGSSIPTACYLAAEVKRRRNEGWKVAWRRI